MEFHPNKTTIINTRRLNLINPLLTTRRISNSNSNLTSSHLFKDPLLLRFVVVVSLGKGKTHQYRRLRRQRISLTDSVRATINGQ